MYLTTSQRYAARLAELHEHQQRKRQRRERNRHKRDRKRLDYLNELRNLQYIINLRDTP